MCYLGSQHHRVAVGVNWQFDILLPFLGQTEENAKLAGNYLHAILWSFPAALSFVVFKEIVTVLGKPQLLITIAVAAIPLNAIANYCLAFGKLGLPTLGLAGLGWASTLISWLSILSAVALFVFDKSFKEKHLFRYWREFKSSIVNQILQLGWPLMAQLGAELILFTAVALLMGYWGTTLLAADEIVMSVLDIAIVIPWGISYAVAIRVAQAIGEENSADAFRAAIISFFLVLTFTVTIAFVFWLFPEKIVAFYLDATISENLFFKFAAIFQIFYGIHFVALGALQGLLDTRLPMLINSVSYWLIGIVGGYIFGEIWQLQGLGLWWCLILSILVADVLLIFRFIWLLLKYEFQT
ncbi:MAG: MATE family efflux transporter [Cyanobacteria bacterium J06635_10]